MVVLVIPIIVFLKMRHESNKLSAKAKSYTPTHLSFSVRKAGPPESPTHTPDPLLSSNRQIRLLKVKGKN